MDEHAERITRPLREVWTDFQHGKASLLDLSRTAHQAAAALDHSNAELLKQLEAADGALEHAYCASEREDHYGMAASIMAPILAAMQY